MQTTAEHHRQTKRPMNPVRCAAALFSLLVCLGSGPLGAREGQAQDASPQGTPAESTAIEKAPVEYVDPMIGTATSRWMLYPGPSRPFGMVKLSPDNQGDSLSYKWKGGYDYRIENIAGFSHVHSWTMGGLRTMPTTGPLQTQAGPEDDPDAGYRSRFRHARESASPGYYAVTLDDYGVRAELTATTRAGFQRYGFPDGADSARVLFDLKFPTEYGFEVQEARVAKVSATEIEGYSQQHNISGMKFPTRPVPLTSKNEYTVHFVARFDQPMTALGGWTGEGEEKEMQRDVRQIIGRGDVGAFAQFAGGPEGDTVRVKTGISLVSVEQARRNLEAETSGFGWDFAAARRAARAEWNDLLGRIAVTGGTETDKRKFYTNFYRSYTARTTWSDHSGTYVDMCEREVRLEDPSSPVYGSDAFWNTFWNLNQLWTLATPGVADKWVRSLLEIDDRGGWLPKGPTGVEYSSIMVGSHEVPFIVSAYQKGIRGYDVEKAYEAIRHVQTTPGRAHLCSDGTLSGGRVGNLQLASYLEKGYVPLEEAPTSITLEYAYDDFAAAQMAEALGREEDAERFTERAASYRTIFDPDTRYVRPKRADGSWLEPFDPFSGTGFVEGNAWQYTWFVPHDVQGLIGLMGGRTPFVERLAEGFRKARAADFNAHGDQFAEATVNHGNQPNMQAAYLFNHAGAPWRTQKWARAIMDEYYGTAPTDGWPGDEDQGQGGAWLVMSALGLFEMDGGVRARPTYEIGSPLFEKATIHLDSDYYDGDTFVIEAVDNSKENKYVQSATLNGEPLEKPWFYVSDVTGGGRLVLQMGPEPNKSWGADPEDAPPSMSRPR